MEFHFERRASASALWARRIAVFSGVLLITAGAGHRYGAVDTIPFFWLLGLVGGLALLAIVLAGVGFFRLWTNGDRGGRAATRAVLVAVVVLIPFGIGGWRAYSLPRLTDISSDIASPPPFPTAQRRRPADANPIRPATAEEAEAQLLAYPAVTGRRYSQPVDRLNEIIEVVLTQLGWKAAHHTDPQMQTAESLIEIVARSLVFGFVSDVVVRVVDEGESTYVDVRSNSRYGIHDLGDNAEKIQRFLAALDAEVAARNMPINVEEN
ncbi:MAG: DUF1499 domain-containing protein [Rhizobiaceae bacterium]|nr:DUF1499 domain-containing protein [Rhizobiaceae bacterium]